MAGKLAATGAGGYGWTLAELAVAFFLLCFCSLGLIWQYLDFIASFPTEYSWSDLFINYQGGFLRRGLLGAILSPFAGMRYFAPCVASFFLLIYILWYICIGRLLFAAIDRSLALLLLGSPAIFAFLCHGNNSFGGLFARKDIFIMIAFTASMYFSVLAWRKKWPLSLLLCIVAVIYICGELIHELLCFYMALPFLLLMLLFNQPGQRKTIVLFFVGIYLLTGIYLLFFNGTFEQREAVFSFWKQLYPQLHDAWDGTALEYIGEGLGDRDDKDYLLPYLRNYPVRLSMVKVLFLTALPILMAAYKHRFQHVLVKTGGKTGAILFYIFSLATIIGVFSLMNDFGRMVSTLSVYVIVYLLLLQTVYREQYGEPPARNMPWLKLENGLFFAFAMLYLCSWRVKFWITLEDDTYLAMQLWQDILLYGN